MYRLFVRPIDLALFSLTSFSPHFPSVRRMEFAKRKSYHSHPFRCLLLPDTSPTLFDLVRVFLVEAQTSLWNLWHLGIQTWSVWEFQRRPWQRFYSEISYFFASSDSPILTKSVRHAHLLTSSIVEKRRPRVKLSCFKRETVWNMLLRLWYDMTTATFKLRKSRNLHHGIGVLGMIWGIATCYCTVRWNQFSGDNTMHPC